MEEKKDNKKLASDKLFLGHTPSEARKFIVYFLKKNKEKYPKVHIPCAGEFSLVKCALDAGYKPQDISCSDICLFTTLLGNYFAGKPITTAFFHTSERCAKDLSEYDDEGHKIAVLMFYMKIHQYRDYFFEQLKLEAILDDKKVFIEQMYQKLKKMKEVYGGIDYFEEDLRDAIVEKKDTITIINPPAFAKGYEKMFNFKADIQFETKVPEFSLNKEYNNGSR